MGRGGARPRIPGTGGRVPRPWGDTRVGRAETRTRAVDRHGTPRSPAPRPRFSADASSFRLWRVVGISRVQPPGQVGPTLPPVIPRNEGSRCAAVGEASKVGGTGASDRKISMGGSRPSPAAWHLATLAEPASHAPTARRRSPGRAHRCGGVAQGAANTVGSRCPSALVRFLPDGVATGPDDPGGPSDRRVSRGPAGCMVSADSMARRTTAHGRPWRSIRPHGTVSLGDRFTGRGDDRDGGL